MLTTVGLHPRGLAAVPVLGSLSVDYNGFVRGLALVWVIGLCLPQALAAVLACFASLKSCCCLECFVHVVCLFQAISVLYVNCRMRVRTQQWHVCHSVTAVPSLTAVHMVLP
jgi:hypothetical protein